MVVARVGRSRTFPEESAWCLNTSSVAFRDVRSSSSQFFTAALDSAASCVEEFPAMERGGVAVALTQGGSFMCGGM